MSTEPCLASFVGLPSFKILAHVVMFIVQFLTCSTVSSSCVIWSMPCAFDSMLHCGGIVNPKLLAAEYRTPCMCWKPSPPPETKLPNTLLYMGWCLLSLAQLYIGSSLSNMACVWQLCWPHQIGVANMTPSALNIFISSGFNSSLTSDVEPSYFKSLKVMISHSCPNFSNAS